MMPAPPAPPSRARGLLLGLVCGARPRTPADGPLALVVADLIAGGPLDFRQLASRWVACLESADLSPDPATEAALRFLAAHDRPPAAGECPSGQGGMVRALPVAIATHRSPRALLSASYHVARLTDADALSAWAAVAVSVTAAQFLLNRKDFVPDVIGALRVNDAPAPLLEAIRRVPLLRRDDLPLAAGAEDAAVRALTLVLWAAHHERSVERAMTWLPDAAGTGGHEMAAVSGLLGARDGEESLPARWLRPTDERTRIRSLADRLMERYDRP